MVKTYYAYLAIAGGYLLSLAGGQLDNEAVYIVANGLIALGGIALRRFSPWYFRAAGVTLACIVLRSAQFLLPVLTLPYLLACGGRDVLLCLGFAEQRKRCGLGCAAEYVLLALAAAQRIGGALLLTGAVNSKPFLFQNLLILVNTGGILFLIGIVFDIFRTQKLALKMEAEGNNAPGL